MTDRRPLVAGNWKMNGLSAAAAELDALAKALADRPAPACDVMIAPPFTLLAPFVASASGTPIAIGGQDCSHLEPGAHTGDIAAVMLRDIGATSVIVGHSERRQDHHETDDLVRLKAEAAHEAGLVAIVCIGETEPERDRDQTLNVVTTQLAGSVPDAATADNTIIAYEPVWAIGTGRTPTVEQIAEVHAAMRQALTDRLADGAEMTLLYGGSVKPGNAAEIFAIANVDGALVGGASLKAADFGPIVAALAAA